MQEKLNKLTLFLAIYGVNKSCGLRTNITSLYTSNPYYSNPQGYSYTWTSGYPQSCECAENGVAKSSCDLFKCNCVCDITAGKCDYNCCCDPDCTEDQIRRFRSVGYCAYDGSAPNYLEYCYDSSELYAVNPRAPMGGSPTAREAVGRALCVEKTNYAVKSDFYQDIGIQGVQIFNQDGGKKEYSYVYTNQIQVETTENDKYFDRNDSIAAFWNNSRTDGLVSAGLGYLQLPQADNRGFCNDWNFASFENEVVSQDNSCVRTLSISPDQANSSFQEQCIYQQSVARYVTDLWVARSANLIASSGAIQFSDALHVQLGSLLYRDPRTGEEFDVLRQWNENHCETMSISNSSSLDTNNCYFGTESSQIFNNATVYFCANAVRSITYNINHTASEEGRIRAVIADVTVSDISIIVPSTLMEEETVGFEQSFGVHFESVDSSALSTSNGNLVHRSRSGNPGYIVGLPIIFGIMNRSVDTVNELVSGMTLPTTNNQLCPQSFVDTQKSTVNFGYDSISGCLMSLSRQQLKDFCCSGASGSCMDNAQNQILYDSPFVDKSTGRPYFLNVTEGYIGIYGDADPLDSSQWLQLTPSIPTDFRQWNDKTSTCKNVFSGLNVQFLISFTGERSNPQNKIVSASAEVVTSDWTFGSPVDQVSQQTFQLSVTVSHVFKNINDLEGYQPPAPPVLFNVPYDVFYPFLTSSTSPKVNFSAWIFVIWFFTYNLLL